MMLLTANLAVYLLMLLGWMLRDTFPMLPSALTDVLALPGDINTFIRCPWTILTYMFTHISFIHLTVNMLWLLGIGPALRGDGQRTALTYIAGGVTGGMAFICMSTMLPDTGTITGETGLAGASAAVAAIITSAAILYPERRMKLLPAVEIKLIWLALAALATLLIGCPLWSPPGVAHAGGIIAGIAAGTTMRKRETRTTRRAMLNARIITRRQAILHKAGRSGFASLSEDERRELFNSPVNPSNILQK